MSIERPNHLTNTNMQSPSIDKSAPNPETSVNKKVSKTAFQTLKGIFFSSKKTLRENTLEPENNDWVIIPSEKEKKQENIIKINQEIENLQKHISERESEITSVKRTLQIKQIEASKINTEIQTQEISIRKARVAHENSHYDGMFAEDTEEIKDLEKFIFSLKNDKKRLVKELITNERIIEKKSQEIQETATKIQHLSEVKATLTSEIINKNPQIR